jgi:agmatinase
LKFLDAYKGFLAIEDTTLVDYRSSSVVVQQMPYEHTSSYLAGSKNGPDAILSASHYVEYYDEELEQETHRKCGISTQEALDFRNHLDQSAVDLIRENTKAHLDNNKFVITLGAEHTITFGVFEAFKKKYPNVSILQIDAHSDLRQSYQGNPLSHACVMARINDLDVKISQVGIRAQCKEEAELIKNSPNIQTFYSHQIQHNADYIAQIISHLSDTVYITIDADGFDPSIVPAVGTAEPGGLLWHPCLDLLREVCSKKNIVGFDVVECAPIEGQIQSEYLLAQLVYKVLGYSMLNPSFQFLKK